MACIKQTARKDTGGKPLAMGESSKEPQGSNARRKVGQESNNGVFIR